MQGKDSWWCDGCGKEVPQTTAYWLIVAVTTNRDEDGYIKDAAGQRFKGGDFCDECIQKMIKVIP